MVDSRRSGFIPIFIIGVLFFIFGFITWLNATLIPYLRMACELTAFESFWVTFAFYISYFVMAFPSSWVLEKTGFKNGMSVGLVTMALGALIFIPAAYSRMYGLFLTGLFIQGTGLAVLQTASNPYVTILGPIESAAKRISIMGVANKFAGILSPMILGAIVLKGADGLVARLAGLSVTDKNIELDLLALRVVVPYVVMAIALFVLAALVRFSSLPEVEAKEDESEQGVSRKSLFDFPYLWLGFIAIFVYVGVEVVAVDTLISYGVSLGFEIAEAKFFSSFTLGAMIAGYFFGIITIPRYISQSAALKYFAILGMLISIVATLTHGYTSVLMIALLGFANSIMWPAIWPLAIDGLGKHTKKGSALLIMGIAGGALLPMLYGGIAQTDFIHLAWKLSKHELLHLLDGGLAHTDRTREAYWVLVPCYVYILFFAAKGHRMGKIIH